MSGGRCPRRKKMMGRGPDGGCGTDERPSRSISRVPASLPEIVVTAKENSSAYGVDFFSQAHKVLAERSPFDFPEDGSGASGGLSVNTLPTGLAGLLKQTDSRKRHKKSHSGADKKAASRVSDRAKGGKNIWSETEVYFRDLVPVDIDALLRVCSPIRSLTASECFLIPNVGNEKIESGVNAESSNKNLILNCEDNVDRNEAVNTNAGNGDAHVSQAMVTDATVDCRNGNVVDLDLSGGENPDRRNEQDEAKQNDEQYMEIDSLGGQSKVDCLPEEDKVCSVSDSASSLQWLLGCRNRIIMTSERPSKKRKLIGRDAGLEKILIGSSCGGNSSLCDFCCEGETGNQSNQLVVCSSCKVGVHRKCYGLKGDVGGSWVCSWCGRKDDKDSTKHLCVLCPKQGGALKPLDIETNKSSTGFAHLFCSLWMPEVYIEDLNNMEPVKGVSEIKETRTKLVCNVCKVKCGACVRCSYGTCRAAFHPICAREARHRIEVWGKYGSDIVELRAFCSKHSELPDGKQQKKNGQNGDKIAVHVEAPDNISEKSADSEPREIGLSDSRLSDANLSECVDGDHVSEMGMSERSGNEDANLCDSVNFPLILRKLIDRGKVSMNDLALEIGISSDSLLSSLAEDNFLPDLKCKIIKWLRNHAYLSALHKKLKVKLKSKLLSKAEVETNDRSDDRVISESGCTDPVKPNPRCRTRSNVGVLGDDKVICSSEEILSDSGMLVDEVKVDQLCGEPEDSSEVIVPGEKTSIDYDRLQDSLATCLPQLQGSQDSQAVATNVRVDPQFTAVFQQGTSSVGQANPVHSDFNPVLPDLRKVKELSSFYVHPYIQKKLLHIQNGKLLGDDVDSLEGIRRLGETSSLEACPNASFCCDHQNIHQCSIDKSNNADSEQLIQDKKQRVCVLSPADEVEGEIIYFQRRLLENAVARKHFTDNLISKVGKTLPQEIDATRAQRWDAVLVNQYLNELREAKKRGRKERRHKEAQAVLAAATAAAAASSRISSLRKDSYDDSTQEKFGISIGRAGISSQLMPRPKETLARVAVARNSSEKYSDFVQPEFSKEHPRSCDICRRFETILNPILVCSSCKVAVHLDCYRSIKESTGPWYCELCEELSSAKCTAAASVNFLEKPYFVAECGLCPGTSGAFRRSTDGHWVHAFCAEWVFEPTFRRGQVNPVEGVETVAKGVHVCCICHRKYGVCIKCGHGQCHTTFHPSCARSAGLYMTVKTVNGKLQHKAYCEKHGIEQRAKAETQKHGVEELKSMKQIRVELERLRLLCERIIKREKIKRELVLCSHSVLACKRDHVARSVLVHSPFFHPDASSESATTSLKGNTDESKSCDAVQRSDDVTVDSTVSVKNRVKVTMDTDQKTDDSSTSQNHLPRKPLERASLAGKKIPLRASLASRVDDGEWSSKSRKRFETLEKEMVMTSDQASMKNQQLPKGYFYIPVDCLPKEKQINQDDCPDEPLENHR
ncbi:PHD finger family protein [Euphorbia peplus]|nr:PHD finger family protein [Euphorbia peplus]